MATLNPIRETQYTYDAALQLKDSYAVTASAAAQVGGSNKILDLGDVDAIFAGDLVLDVSVADIAGNDELYEVILEGSDSATFASGIEEVATCRLGPNETLTGGGDTDSNAGRYVVPFRNERNGRRYRYLRLYTVVTGGAGGGSITYEGFIGVRKM